MGVAKQSAEKAHFSNATNPNFHKTFFTCGSHEGIADNKSIQMTGGAVAGAAANAPEICCCVVDGVKEVVRER